jgi:hypothetical protein
MTTTRAERWMLGGAWTLIAASLAWGGWRLASRPDVQPWVLREAARIEAMKKSRLHPLPPHTAGPPAAGATVPEAAPIHRWTGFLTPRIIALELPPAPITLKVLRIPLYSGKATLDGVELTWTLADAKPFPLRPHETRKDQDPVGFVIERRREGGTPELLTVVGPKVRSVSDSGAEPRLRYEYQVSALGTQTDRQTGKDAVVAVTAGGTVEARTPSPVRVKLAGGDRNFAILRVETYNRTERKWVPSTHRVSPGGAIGESGWTLGALRFDGFTLTAEAGDDEGGTRVLRTDD